MEIKVLARRGTAVREIARQTRLSRNTVRRYSRASFVRFTAGEDAMTLCECLREACVYFGGTPEQVLFDNAKSVVVERGAFGEGQHRWNTRLLALAETYGFTPKVCRPYRAKTKGKVERFNRYRKESFVVPLAATLKQSGLKLDVEAANARIGQWLAEVANVRVHATTRERPAALLPLPMSTSAPVAVLARPLSPETQAGGRD